MKAIELCYVLAGLYAFVSFMVFNLAFFNAVYASAMLLAVGFVLGVGTAAGTIFSVHGYYRVRSQSYSSEVRQ